MRTSQLDSPGDRYLSLCIQYALDEGWLSASDLFQEFPPQTLMSALEPAPELRSNLLIEAAGVHARIAPKKSTGAAAEDLQIALDEGVCTAENILALVPVDEQVRYLERDALWQLLIRDQFWLTDADKEQARMLDMIESGLEQELIDLPRLVRAVTPEQMAEDFPRDLMNRAFTVALHSGLDGTAFGASLFKDTVELSEWLQHISLSHFWENVIRSEIAASAGLVSLDNLKPGAAAGGGAQASSHTESNKHSSKKKKNKKESQAEKKSAAEVQARKRAIDKLKSVDRLPANVDTLRSPVLLGMESMYDELLKATTDEAREECVVEAFPNPSMLHEALLTIAVTLDPRLTEESLKERGADTSALIQLVLFEERRRTNRSTGATPSSPPPAPLGDSSAPPPVSVIAAKSPSLPPPLPQQVRRASTPPPPLPNQARGRGR